MSQFPWDEESAEPIKKREIVMPANGDVLFKPFNDDHKKNATIKTGVNKFFLFSDSYKTAAEDLYSHFDGTPFTTDTLCYPYIFLNRHFLELRLKELMLGLAFAKKQKYEFTQGHHSLKKLWLEFVTAAKSREGYKIDADQKAAVGLLIDEFDKIDPGSFSFRYPIDKNGEPSLPMEKLDIENFKNTMQKLYDFFDEESYKVGYFVDMTQDYLDMMVAEYHSSF